MSMKVKVPYIIILHSLGGVTGELASYWCYPHDGTQTRKRKMRTKPKPGSTLVHPKRFIPIVCTKAITLFKILES